MCNKKSIICKQSLNHKAKKYVNEINKDNMLLDMILSIPKQK